MLMYKLIPGNQKHLALDDRIIIEKDLDLGCSLRNITMQLKICSSTIFKEIKNHRPLQKYNAFNEPKNKYTLFERMQKNICEIYAPIFKRIYKLCNHCNSHCSDSIPRSYHCSKLDETLFVCNACSMKKGYRLDEAHTAYKQ